jgi:hypothetical protein
MRKVVYSNSIQNKICLIQRITKKDYVQNSSKLHQTSPQKKKQNKTKKLEFNGLVQDKTLPTRKKAQSQQPYVNTIN